MAEPLSRRRLRDILRKRKYTRHRGQLDIGLERLGQRLGLREESTPSDDSAEKLSSALSVHLTSAHPRMILYTPDVDGQADPGEVVWFWAPTDPGAESAAQERAMLVVGRSRNRGVLGLLISANPEHDDAENWLDIGAGEWDREGRNCWARLDRLVGVPESALRREGVLFPRGRFERIAAALRSRYGWG